MGGATNDTLALAMVLLKRAELPDVAALRAAMREEACGTPGFAVDEAHDGTITLNNDAFSAVVTLMPAQIPGGEAENAAEASWHWPEALEAVRAHTAHLLVAVMGGGDRILSHLALTRIVGACLGENAVAVYWGAAGIVHDPREFAAMAAESSREDLPVPLWVGVTLAPSEDDEEKIEGVTRGLEALGFHEFEIYASRKPPEDVAQFLMMSSWYVLDTGARLDTGETIGRTAKEKIKVTRRASKWDPEREALVLAF